MPGEVLQLAGPTQTLARTHGSGLAPVASGRIETSITFSGAPGIGPDGPATKEPAAATPSISLSIDSTEKRGISGWAWCGSDSTEPCTVELWADGVRRAAARADRFRADLLAAGIGTGIAGFDLPIPDSVLLRGRELRLVAHHPDAESVEWFSRVPSLRKATVWTDFSDLLQYLRDNRLPTGIQRVQIEIARAAVAAGPGEFHHKAVAFDEIRRFWYEVDHRRILDLVDTAGDTGVAAATWEASYAQFEAAVPGMPLAAFVPGDFLLNIGSSWWLPDYMLYVRTLQEERGVQYVPFVHDCIPMITPQFCSAGLVEDFERWFREVLDAAPFFLVNSDCTRRDLLRFADALGFGQRSATTIRLDGRSGAGDPAAADTSGPGADLARARLGVSRPYVLFVATLEIRKNHLAVFETWKRLLDRMGPDAVPMLVCVGKRGWLIDYTLNWLEVHPELKRHVRLLSGISDADLACLYAGAMFTVYASHYEGWGLPVTEALCAGKVPVIPNHSSLPEAGGRFALYYDDAAGLESAVGTLLADPAALRDAEARIAAEFQPRGWDDIFAEIGSAIAAWNSGFQPHRPRPRAALLARGVPHGLSRPPGASQGAAPVADGTKLRAGFGWWTPEIWGCWTRDPVARLAFAWPAGLGQDSHLYLCLRGAPWATEVEVSGTPFERTKVALPANARRLVRVRTRADLQPDRACEVEIACAPGSLAEITNGADRRSVGVGIEAICLCGRDDVAGRLDMRDFAEFGEW